MTIGELKAEIVIELLIELKNENVDADLLDVKVKSAIREVKAARRYPATYSTSMIEADLEKHYSYIKDIALYDVTKIGAEGQDSYSADGESIKYMDRSRLFDGIYPIART